VVLLHGWEKCLINSKSVLFLFFLILSIGVFPYSIEGKTQVKPFVALYPYSVSMDYLNTTKFIESLNVSMEIGFKGINLMNVECFYYDDDNGSLQVGDRLLWAIREITKRGLDVMVSIRWYNGLDYSFPYSGEAYSPNQINKFPNNETLLNWYLEFAFNVSKLISKEKVNRICFYYVFNWMDFYNWKVIAEGLYYENGIRKIVKAFYDGSNGFTSVYFVSDLMEYQYNTYKIGVNLPKPFDYVSGYGFTPYDLYTSPKYDKKRVDTYQIDWLYDYWKKTKRDVFIAEWGYRTMGVFEHGFAYSEYWKEKLIIEKVEYLNKEYPNIVWSFFGLYDMPTEGADWGIVYNDFSLKPSGLAMKEILTTTIVEPKWYENPIKFSLIIFAIIIVLYVIVIPILKWLR